CRGRTPGAIRPGPRPRRAGTAALSTAAFATPSHPRPSLPRLAAGAAEPAGIFQPGDRQYLGGAQFEILLGLLCRKCSTAPSIRTQSCFDCSKTDITGAGYFGSAIAPTATAISAGRVLSFQ